MAGNIISRGDAFLIFTKNNNLCADLLQAIQGMKQKQQLEIVCHLDFNYCEIAKKRSTIVDLEISFRKALDLTMKEYNFKD